MDDGAHWKSLRTNKQGTFHMQRCQSDVQRFPNLGHHWSAADVPVWTGVQWPCLLLPHWGESSNTLILCCFTDSSARRYCNRVLHLPTLPQQLGSLYQRSHLLQCGRQHSSCKHQYVSRNIPDGFILIWPNSPILPVVHRWICLQLPDPQACIWLVEALQLWDPIFQVSPSENKSLIHDVRRFAPSCHGYRHCYCNDHHFLRAGLPCYHFQLVGKHSGIQYVRCEVRALVDCSQGKLFRKGSWRVLIEDVYMIESFYGTLSARRICYYSQEIEG